jgi:hypothetical protein
MLRINVGTRTSTLGIIAFTETKFLRYDGKALCPSRSTLPFHQLEKRLQPAKDICAGDQSP